jgi:hypothetical protein
MSQIDPAWDRRPRCRTAAFAGPAERPAFRPHHSVSGASRRRERFGFCEICVICGILTNAAGRNE